MARTRGDSAKDRADWRRLTKLAEKNGWNLDDDDEPRFRVHFIDGTLEELRSMGLSLGNVLSDGETDDDETSTEDDPAEPPENEEPTEEPAEEPRPRSRARYFGGK